MPAERRAGTFPRRPRNPLGPRGLLLRLLVLAPGYWALTEGDPAGAAFGVPTVLVALRVSAWLPPPRAPRWDVPGVLIFAGAFLARSLRGGIDVALRALTPGLPLSPVLVRYPLRLPPGSARNLFLSTLSLMPGTLAASLDDDTLEVHVLVDMGEGTVRELEAWEARVARALGETLETPRA